MKNKRKLESIMNWFILITLFGYFVDPEINFTLTKIILPITALFACYKLFKQ